MGKENYQSNLQINLQYQILKLVSDVAKYHTFPAKKMPKIVNHAKIRKIMKNHEIMPTGTPEIKNKTEVFFSNMCTIDNILWINF